MDLIFHVNPLLDSHETFHMNSLLRKIRIKKIKVSSAAILPRSFGVEIKPFLQKEFVSRCISAM